MTFRSEQAFPAFPERLSWNAQDIADAVPLRLFELYTFDPADAAPSANRPPRPRPFRREYMPAASSLFRVRG